MKVNKRYCVFSGSSMGTRPEYAQAARELGARMAGEGVGLVYGGGSVGLMGTVADAVLAAGGEVIGVIPQSLVDRELAHRGLSDLRVTTTMHERKALMAELSDAFIALPGGLGTLDETFEIWTWAQLGIHSKPVALLNCEGFYDGLGSFLDHIVAQGFLKQAGRKRCISEREPEALLKAIREYVPAPQETKWTAASPSNGIEL